MTAPPNPADPNGPAPAASGAGRDETDDYALTVAWRLCLALAARRRQGVAPRPLPYRLRDGPDADPPELIETQPGDPNAVVRWHPDAGWQVAAGWPAEASVLFELYWPLLSLAPGQRYGVGHLGQSIDGRIATRNGHSRYINGPDNLLHLHRMRALCDAVLVGASTVAADDPLLTTRLVPGEHALRVVVDPTAKLSPGLRVFTDEQAPTYLACGLEYERLAVSRLGKGRVIGVPLTRRRLDLDLLLDRLAELGATSILVEGGGVTVSRFLEGQHLDRLQIAIAPFWLGAGREGLQLPGVAQLDACPRPPHRIYRMGADVLWDFDLRATVSADPSSPAPARSGRLSRIA